MPDCDVIGDDPQLYALSGAFNPPHELTAQTCQNSSDLAAYGTAIGPTTMVLGLDGVAARAALDLDADDLGLARLTLA